MTSFELNYLRKVPKHCRILRCWWLELQYINFERGQNCLEHMMYFNKNYTRDEGNKKADFLMKNELKLPIQNIQRTDIHL